MLSNFPPQEIRPEDLAPAPNAMLGADGLLPPLEGSEASQEAFEGGSFYENLAENIEPEKLTVLANDLLEDIEDDLESRKGWERTCEIGLKYLGVKIDEYRQTPFMDSCAAFDTNLVKALLHFVSTAKRSLFPAAGPAKSQIIGVPTEATEDEGERVKMFLNYFLTIKDRGYYPDSEQLLLNVGLFGCAFRKVWHDSIENEPRGRMIRPQDLIVNNDTSNLLESSRISQKLELTKREILLKEKNGEFVKSEMPDDEDDDSDTPESQLDKTIKRIEGVSTESYEKKSTFDYFESHVDLPPNKVFDELFEEGEDSEIPRPYIVTVCAQTKKIVKIKRNWKPEDNNYKKDIYFVDYAYLKGFGIYAWGLAHLLGSNQIVLTTILRQLVDCGTLKNFPGGLKQRGMRIENNDKSPGPAEFLEVETNGSPIQDCVMLMPYGEPSQVLAALRGELKQDTAEVAFTAEAELPDVGPNTPVGTTVAMLEVATKNQSSIMSGLYNSLTRELELFKNLFAEYLGDEQYPFAVPGKESFIMKSDFSDKVNVIPVADPNVLTTTHRLIIADALINSAASAPEIHNMREVYKRRYEAMNVQNIDEILPKPDEPRALDPTTENTMAMLGKPIKISLFQDDDSHLTVHDKFYHEVLMINPNAAAQIQLHIQLHKAAKIFKQFQQMQMQQGMQSPQIPDGQEEQMLMMPEIQNAIAAQDAQQATAELQQQQQEMEEQKQSQVDPQKVLLADIEQRREAAYLKDEETKLRAETESFKAQLNHETEMEKMETQREMAEEKNETSLEIERMKHQQNLEQKRYDKEFSIKKPNEKVS